MAHLEVRRALRGHSGEDESYFVSMTDLMVGMLFVFIIMLMAFALNLREQEETFEDTTRALTQANEARTAMLRDIRRAMEQHGVTVTIDEANGVLRLPESLLFARGAFTLQDEGREALQKLARVLASIVPCYAVLPFGEPPPDCSGALQARLEAVFIEGHTDDVQIVGRMASGISNNWELSTARAIATYNELTAAAPLLGRLMNGRDQSLLGVSGYAENRPVNPADTEEARAANRRIDLRFLMATPNMEELQRIRDRVQRGLSN